MPLIEFAKIRAQREIARAAWTHYYESRPRRVAAVAAVLDLADAARSHFHNRAERRLLGARRDATGGRIQARAV